MVSSMTQSAEPYHLQLLIVVLMVALNAVLCLVTLRALCRFCYLSTSQSVFNCCAGSLLFPALGSCCYPRVGRIGSRPSLWVFMIPSPVILLHRFILSSVLATISLGALLALAEVPIGRLWVLVILLDWLLFVALDTFFHPVLLQIRACQV